jgi:hypothetical protein
MIADKIMNWCWKNEQNWDKNSPAHKYWKKEVKKKKRSLKWWKQNYKRIWEL